MASSQSMSGLDADTPLPPPIQRVMDPGKASKYMLHLEQKSWKDIVIYQSNGSPRLLRSVRGGHDEFGGIRHGRPTGPIHFFH